MHHYSNDQILCMETKPIIENSSIINQHIPMVSNNPVNKYFIY
jgi:hypothetical protein